MKCQKILILFLMIGVIFVGYSNIQAQIIDFPKVESNPEESFQIQPSLIYEMQAHDILPFEKSSFTFQNSHDESPAIIVSQAFNYDPPYIEDLPEFQEMCLRSDDCNYFDNRYFISLRRNQGETVGNKSSYTTLEAMAFPDICQEYVPFVDLRGHVFDRCSRFGANVGVGCRFAPQCADLCFGLFSDSIFGVNAYYDYRDCRRANFNQLGLGFEILGDCLNFRLNGYLPVGKREVLNSRHVFDDYIGDFFMIQDNFIDSVAGVNFEIESLILRLCSVDVYAAIGPYFYKGSTCRRDIYGSEYRLSARFCDNYWFSIYATHDCLYRTRVMAELSFTFPCYGCDWNWFQPVRRREAIVLDRHSRFFSNF